MVTRRVRSEDGQHEFTAYESWEGDKDRSHWFNTVMIDRTGDDQRPSTTELIVLVRRILDAMAPEKKKAADKHRRKKIHDFRHIFPVSPSNLILEYF